MRLRHILRDHVSSRHSSMLSSISANDFILQGIRVVDETGASFRRNPGQAPPQESLRARVPVLIAPRPPMPTQQASRPAAPPSPQDPGPQDEPMPAAHALGHVFVPKHASLKTLHARCKFVKGSNNTKANRPWLFNYRFPGTEEYGIYYLACIKTGPSCPAITRHPLIGGRGVAHFRACGLPFRDEVDLVRRYGVQGMSMLYLPPDLGSRC